MIESFLMLQEISCCDKKFLLVIGKSLQGQFIVETGSVFYARKCLAVQGGCLSIKAIDL